MLVSLEDREMGAVMRVDLPKVMDGNLTHLADVAAASGADTVVAVIIDATAPRARCATRTTATCATNSTRRWPTTT